MVVYEGINQIIVTFRQLYYIVRSWLSQLSLTDWIAVLPINFRPFVAAIALLLISMAAVGLVKKLSVFM